MDFRRAYAVLLVVTALGFSQPSMAGPNDLAWDAYDRGDDATALRLCRALAEQGDADAQTCLGVMYERGRGVDRDAVEAVRW